MKIMPIFKKYMIPFLEEHDFVKLKPLIFQHKKNPEVKLYFSIQKNNGNQGICLDLRRSNHDQLMTYQLALFLDEPSEMDTAYRDGFWYFDTEEELIGALEEQADLLKEKAFDWLFYRSDLDIDGIIDAKAAERSKTYYSADDFGKQLFINKIRVKRDEWKARRVKPRKWQ